jgi:nitric oxide reductase NorD protein
MLDLLELEETVGRAWHRLIGATAAYPHTRTTRCRSPCSGRCAARWAWRSLAWASASPGHRFGWRQRIGLGNESPAHHGRGTTTVFLPHRYAIVGNIRRLPALYRQLTQ